MPQSALDPQGEPEGAALEVPTEPNLPSTSAPTPEPVSESVPEPVSLPAATVGQCLRAAREAAGLSLQNVAQTLKYSQRQIELIEADNYAALPGITVVRGFVRCYARLLKLDVDALLRMLDERLPNIHADVRPPDNMGVAVQPGNQRELSMVSAAAIVLALAAAILILWHFFGPAPSRSTPNGTASVPVQAVAPKVEDQALPSSPVPQPSTTESASSPPSFDIAKVATPQLLFVFEGRSWIEVTDATKKMIHTGENLAGTELRLNGQPPFDIVVGNAAKVRLTYNDKPVDLAPHTRAEVARLKLE